MGEAVCVCVCVCALFLTLYCDMVGNVPLSVKEKGYLTIRARDLASRLKALDDQVSECVCVCVCE